MAKSQHRTLIVFRLRASNYLHFPTILWLKLEGVEAILMMKPAMRPFMFMRDGTQGKAVPAQVSEKGCGLRENVTGAGGDSAAGRVLAPHTAYRGSIPVSSTIPSILRSDLQVQKQELTLSIAGCAHPQNISEEMSVIKRG